MGPHFGDPVDGAVQVVVACACANLCFHQLASQVAPKEAFDRLHMIGAQHPAEVMMQLQVSGGASRLVHCANNVRAVIENRTFI